MTISRQYTLLIVITLFLLPSFLHGQTIKKRIVETQINKLTYSLRTSDTTLFMSLFYHPKNECNQVKMDHFVFDNLFKECKIHLDTILRQKRPIDKIKIIKEKWDSENRISKDLNTVYLVQADFKSDTKVKKGLFFYFFYLNNSWFFDCELGRTITTD